MLVSQVQRQNNLISFKSRRRDSEPDLSGVPSEELYAYLNTPNKDIKSGAFAEHANRWVASPERTVERRTSKAIPFIDTLFAAALEPGRFGDKVFAGIGRALGWGVFLKTTNSLSKHLGKNQEYNNFTENHPVASSLLGSLGISLIGIGAIKAVGFGLGKIVEYFPKVQKTLQSAYNSLNENRIGKKITDTLNKHWGKTYTGYMIFIGAIVGIAVAKLISLGIMKRRADDQAYREQKLKETVAGELIRRHMTQQQLGQG